MIPSTTTPSAGKRHGSSAVTLPSTSRVSSWLHARWSCGISQRPLQGNRPCCPHTALPSLVMGLWAGSVAYIAGRSSPIAQSAAFVQPKLARVGRMIYGRWTGFFSVLDAEVTRSNVWSSCSKGAAASPPAKRSARGLSAFGPASILLPGGLSAERICPFSRSLTSLYCWRKLMRTLVDCCIAIANFVRSSSFVAPSYFPLL